MFLKGISLICPASFHSLYYATKNLEFPLIPVFTSLMLAAPVTGQKPVELLQP